MKRIKFYTYLLDVDDPLNEILIEHADLWGHRQEITRSGQGERMVYAIVDLATVKYLLNEYNIEYYNATERIGNWRYFMNLSWDTKAWANTWDNYGPFQT